MTQWELAIELDRASEEPLYLQITRAVVEGIRKGRFKPGDTLPGTRALADTLGVNRNTTLAAYRELVAEGWIVSEPDAGTFVAEQPPLASYEGTEGSIASVDSGSWTSPTPLSEPFFQPKAIDREGFSLLPDLPDVRLAPVSAFHRAHGRVMRRQQQQMLQPGWDPRGFLDLRISLCQMLREMRGMIVEPGNVVLTRGLMSTLNLVSRTLFNAGEAVAVESPGNFRVMESFKAAGARLLAVPVDEEGMRVEALEQLLARERVRLVFVSASPQYPTHAVLSPKRRKRLLELARDHGFYVLEADLGLGYQREVGPSLPLASEDAQGSVVYFSSLDQILAPSLQVGFLVGPGPLIKSMAKHRQLIDWPGNQLQEASIQELFLDGEVQRHLRRIRKLTDERRESMVDRLQLHLCDMLDAWDPREGLSLWVRLKAEVPVQAWVDRCAAKGVVFYPGHLYELDHRPTPFVCMGFAAHDAGEQNEAIALMAEAMREVRS